MENLLHQLKTLWKSLTPGRKLVLLGVVAATVAGFNFLMAWTGRPDFQTLFTQLSPEDAGGIVERLKAQKVPYRLTMNGDGIEVPREMVHDLRLALASEGLPQGSGIGFEVFDNTKIGMTEFVQNVNYQRALQGELSRTISQIDEIESARVHIVMPTRSLFLENEKPATASVVVKLRPGKELSPQQIRGILNLVSASISGLEPEKVAVVDNRGRLLTGGSKVDSMAEMTADQFQYQRKLETSMENQIRSMLEEALGPNKAIVRVACALDFVRHEKTEEMYIPENQVVRSEQLFNERTVGKEGAVGGIAGIRSNTVDGNIGVGGMGRPARDPNDDPRYLKNDQTRNYEIGKVVSRKIMPVGQLKRVTAAVLVDGSYVAKSGKKGKTDWEYVARSPEEMEKFTSIVKTAMNFDPSRGDELQIENIPFETSQMALEEEPAEVAGPSLMERVQPFLDYVVMAFFILMGFLFLVRPIVKWLTSAPAGGGEVVRQLPKTVGELEREMGALPGATGYSNQLHRLIAGDNQASSTVMKEWLRQ